MPHLPQRLGDATFEQCYPCREALRAIGAPEILPIALSVDSGLLHRHLRGYKDDRSHQARARMGLRLAAMLAIFLQHHHVCVGEFDSIVLVPSLRRIAVQSIVERLPALRDRYRPALAVSGAGAKSELRADRFTPTRDVRGERALVLDDTFTRGPSLFSATAALTQAGAEVVGPLVLGRHVQPAWGTSEELLSWLQVRTWDQQRCCRCDGERRSPAQLF